LQGDGGAGSLGAAGGLTSAGRCGERAGRRRRKPAKGL